MSLTGGGGGAGLAGLVPRFAHVVGTAAHLLGHVEGELVLTRVVEVTVAHALPHVCNTRHEDRRERETERDLRQGPLDTRAYRHTDGSDRVPVVSGQFYNNDLYFTSTTSGSPCK